MTIRFRLLCFRQVSVLLLTFVSLCALSCSSEDHPKVVLYVSADEYVARQVIDAFEDQTGVHVYMVGDTEAKKTTGLVERLRAEKTNPQADVFWSSEIFQTIALAEEDILDSLAIHGELNWPIHFRDSENLWFGFAARARVIVYSPDRVADNEIPTKWMDLTHKKYKDRVVMADPRFGTTGGHLGAMQAHWGADQYQEFLVGLAANRLRLLTSGNAGVVESVARGEADFGMTDTDDVWAAQARGLNVQLVYPSHGENDGELGTLLIPNTVALIRGGPNPKSARMLIEFLLSEQVERMLVESVSHNIPLRPGLADEYPDYGVNNALQIDYAEAARNCVNAIELAMRILDPSRRGN